MPTKKTIQAARSDAKAGKSASTQAGEFVKSEIDNVRAGKHGVRNTKQAIAIGLSEARREGVKVKQPKKGTVTEKTRKNARRETDKGQGHEPISATRSQASTRALKKESSEPVSTKALSQQTRSAAQKRSAADRSASARMAVDTKGPKVRAEAAKQASHTRAVNNRGK
jgi:Family of unknown function (DUF6496)